MEKIYFDRMGRVFNFHTGIGVEFDINCRALVFYFYGLGEILYGIIDFFLIRIGAFMDF